MIPSLSGEKVQLCRHESLARADPFHELWLSNWRSSHALGPARLFRWTIWGNLNRFTRFCRFVERLNDADVLKTFRARWLGVDAFANAIGEVQELGRELIATANAISRRLAVDRELVGET